MNVFVPYIAGMSEDPRTKRAVDHMVAIAEHIRDCGRCRRVYAVAFDSALEAHGEAYANVCTWRSHSRPFNTASGNCVNASIGPKTFEESDATTDLNVSVLYAGRYFVDMSRCCTSGCAGRAGRSKRCYGRLRGAVVRIRTGEASGRHSTGGYNHHDVCEAPHKFDHLNPSFPDYCISVGRTAARLDPN